VQDTLGLARAFFCLVSVTPRRRFRRSASGVLRDTAIARTIMGCEPAVAPALVCPWPLATYVRLANAVTLPQPTIGFANGVEGRLI
jgi:hypothetical protein